MTDDVPLLVHVDRILKEYKDSVKIALDAVKVQRENFQFLMHMVLTLASLGLSIFAILKK
jgi:hypothetical protein